MSDKTKINEWAKARYDELMAKGKHGHYESMFTVIHEAIARSHMDSNEPERVQVPKRVCEHKDAKGNCPFHNLHCAFPACETLP